MVGLKAFYCDRFEIPTSAGSRFPVSKYALLRQRLTALPELEIEFLESQPLDPDTLRCVHGANYVARVMEGRLSLAEQHLVGFPWSQQLVERARRSAGGTLQACRAALTERVAVNLAGGTHHAKADMGAGYCVFNDVAIAARIISQQDGINRVLIVDADVHQGDGTAEILQADPHLFTFSIHAAGNYPRRKAVSDLDIALPDGVEDREYLRQFRDALDRAFLAARPELIIYLAGADPFEADRLGRLSLSKHGLKRRDEMLISNSRLRHVPLAVVMAGGYAPNVEDIVDIHTETVVLASEYFRNCHATA